MGLLFFSALAALLAPRLWAQAAAAGQSTDDTVSVFLPAYASADWSILRGSILSSDSTQTAYTIFCADSSLGSCEIAGALPFTFAEGPGTLFFTGVSPDTITAGLSCQLKGTTAATCTGHTTLGPGYDEGPLTGPATTVWTSTLTGSRVQWGVLTLSTPPSTTDSLELTGTGEPPPLVTPGPTGTAGPNQSSDGGRLRVGLISFLAMFALQLAAAVAL